MKSLRFQKNNKKEERAQSLVEFALTFTFLLFVLSGVIDFGRVFFTLISLNDAAQEGAMFGSMKPDALADIVERVRTSSSDPIDLTDTSAVKVNVTADKDCAGLDSSNKPYGIEVSVLYDFNFTMPFLTTMVPDNILTLKGSSIHTILYPPCTLN